jgi:ADP-heptose:LPS heptosyltransferase
VSRVLALRALGLGDALTGIPALRGLRRAWPEAVLVLAAPEPLAAWLRGLGVVDEVLGTAALAPVPWAGPPPDVAVNLHGRGPQSHRLLQDLCPGRLVAFACPDAGHDDGPQWAEREHEVDRWCRLVRSPGGECSPEDLRLEVPLSSSGGPVVVLHPGAASGSRRWPADRWAQVARALAEGGLPVTVTGVAAEAGLCAGVAAAHPAVEDRCGRDSLESLAALVGRAALVLCGDTGVAHLATALQVPSVLLFGPTSPDRWGPRVDAHLHPVLWEPRPGDPPGDPHAAEVDVRLGRITAEQVLAAAGGLL